MAGKYGNLSGPGPGRPKGVKNGQGSRAQAKNAREAKKAEKQMIKISKDIVNLTLQMMGPYIYRYMAQAYIVTIQLFYSDYTPRTYQRTKQTQLRKFTIDGTSTGKGPVRKYIRTLKGKGGAVEAGIDVSSAYYENPHPYRMDTETVFTRTFEGGIHGYTELYRKTEDGDLKFVDSIMPMAPPPAAVLEEYLKAYSNDIPFQARYREYLMKNLVKKIIPEAIEKIAKSNKYK